MSLIQAKDLARFWLKETPSGTIDGANTSFTLSQTPVENDAVELTLDGLDLEPGVDYTISGTSITMTDPPVVGQILRASYIQKSGGS